MVINASDVLSVYKKTGGIIDQAGNDASLTSSGPSFADTLKSFASDSVSTIKSGEQAALDGASGKSADMASVVTSINSAEIVLDEVIALRDKVIAAYQAITTSAI